MQHLAGQPNHTSQEELLLQSAQSCLYTFFDMSSVWIAAEAAQQDSHVNTAKSNTAGITGGNGCGEHQTFQACFIEQCRICTSMHTGFVGGILVSSIACIEPHSVEA